MAYQTWERYHFLGFFSTNCPKDVPFYSSGAEIEREMVTRRAVVSRTNEIADGRVPRQALGGKLATYPETRCEILCY